MFSDISRIEVDDKDDIIIMDAKEGCIKIFDKNGKFIRRFGEKGQGPGEIQSFGRMSLSNNLITINDVSNHRFSYYDKNGECIRQIPTGKFRPPDTLADTKGNLYGGVLSFEDRIFTKLMKFDQDFSPLLTITSFEMPKQVPPAILMERIYFKVRRDDSLVWGRTSKYELNILNNDGSTPLLTAAFLCRSKIVEALLDKGADKNIRNLSSKTALETVSGPFEDVKGIYDSIGKGLAPLGLELDYDRIKMTRPKIAEMLR